MKDKIKEKTNNTAKNNKSKEKISNIITTHILNGQKLSIKLNECTKPNKPPRPS